MPNIWWWTNANSGNVHVHKITTISSLPDSYISYYSGNNDILYYSTTTISLYYYHLLSWLPLYYHFIIIFIICGINDYQLHLPYNVWLLCRDSILSITAWLYQYNIIPTMIVYIITVVSISYPHVFCTGPHGYLQLDFGLPTADISAA